MVKSDHPFKLERSLPLTPERIARVPRNIGSIARSTYRGIGPTVDQDALANALRMAGRIADFLQYSVQYTTTPFLLLPQSFRSYLLIQNLDAALNLFLGFNFQPSSTLGLRLAPGEAYEPYVVPQNDVFIAGSGTGTLSLLFATI